jgi:NADPH-dependent glutamate synthase beta subunit-like oxidoreductase/NAD-dependent dihydropyrimidine dehydrogenase PreA subunit
MGKKDTIETVICKEGGKIYLPPCQIKCPVGEDIQRTNAMLSLLSVNKDEAEKQVIKIGDQIYEKNPMFAICGYVCGLCEKECNYKDKTGAIRRKMLKRFISDYYVPYLDKKPALPAPTKDKVAVIGSGPAGMMAAYELCKKGYKVTIFEKDKVLGGAVRLIPRYRLPASVLDGTLKNLVRISHAEVKYGWGLEDGSKTYSTHTLEDLKEKGFKAVFVATGTPIARPLTIEGRLVMGEDFIEGVLFGLPMLYDVGQGKLPHDLYKGKKVLVIGGGNVAFDAARVARRLGGEVTLACLECADKKHRDGIPADLDEIEGAAEEGIKIVYSRGVSDIVSENGIFKKAKCPRCISVFSDKGFDPRFDYKDSLDIEADVLLITIGQGPERKIYQREGLYTDQGRLDVDPVTLMSNKKPGVFIGGDARRIGYAADAMAEGVTAAESIDRFIRDVDMKAGRQKEYQKAEAARLENYKPQPQLVWKEADKRLNFDLFEKGFTLKQAIAEAQRCLYCGPCSSCKGCVAMEIQAEIADIKVNEEKCSGCAICVAVCRYDAPKLEKRGKSFVSVIDLCRCKRCGLCVSVCPSDSITITDGLAEQVDKALAEVSKKK